jgi:hypothetical protein
MTVSSLKIDQEFSIFFQRQILYIHYTNCFENHYKINIITSLLFINISKFAFLHLNKAVRLYIYWMK